MWGSNVLRSKRAWINQVCFSQRYGVRTRAGKRKDKYQISLRDAASGLRARLCLQPEYTTQKSNSFKYYLHESIYLSIRPSILWTRSPSLCPPTPQHCGHTLQDLMVSVFVLSQFQLGLHVQRHVSDLCLGCNSADCRPRSALPVPNGTSLESLEPRQSEKVFVVMMESRNLLQRQQGGPSRSFITRQ